MTEHEKPDMVLKFFLITFVAQQSACWALSLQHLALNPFIDIRLCQCRTQKTKKISHILSICLSLQLHSYFLTLLVPFSSCTLHALRLYHLAPVIPLCPNKNFFPVTYPPCSPVYTSCQRVSGPFPIFKSKQRSTPHYINLIQLFVVLNKNYVSKLKN